MGANTSVSENAAKQLVENAQDVAQQFVTKCTTTSDQRNSINLGDCTIENSTVKITTQNTLDTACIQNVTTQNNMKSNIQTQLAQNAQAVAQNFGIGINTSVSKNLSTSINNVAQTITQLYTTECINAIKTDNTVICDNGIIRNSSILIDNTNDSYNSCTNNINSTNIMIGEIVNALEQSSTAEEANAFTAFIIIFFIFIGIFAIFFCYSLNGPIGWVIVIVVLILVITSVAYSAFAYSRGNYPYQPSS